jgi:hypothetical protein
MTTVLVDTGPLVAAIERCERNHHWGEPNLRRFSHHSLRVKPCLLKRLTYFGLPAALAMSFSLGSQGDRCWSTSLSSRSTKRWGGCFGDTLHGWISPTPAWFV